MESQNNATDLHKATKNAQEDKQTNSATLPPVVQCTDDMELDEEQLDIVSGGNGTNPFLGR